MLLIFVAFMLAQSDTEKADAKLVVLIDEAVKKRLSIGEVEGFVAKEALISTQTKRGRDVFDYARILSDDGKSIRPARDALIWVRAPELSELRIIGIIWRENGESRVILGKLVPP